MPVSITVTRKRLALALLVVLLIWGSSWVLASHDDPNIAHACVNNGSGTIKIVQGPEDCSANEQALEIVTEAGLSDISIAIDDLWVALDEEIAARTAADTALDTESANRAAADAALQAALDTEIANRAAADTALQTALDTESAARAAAIPDSNHTFPNLPSAPVPG